MFAGQGRANEGLLLPLRVGHFQDENVRANGAPVV